MPSEINHQVLLSRRPDKAPKPEDFELGKSDMPTLGNGQLLVRNSFLSLDPYMRGRMNDGKDPYAPPFALGEPLGAATVGTVVESHQEQYKAGDLVVGPGG